MVMFNYVLFFKDELLYSFGKKELNMPKIGPLFHKFKMVRLSNKSTLSAAKGLDLVWDYEILRRK